MQLNDGEKILGAVYNTSNSLRISVDYISEGKAAYPENCFFITDKRIIFAVTNFSKDELEKKSSEEVLELSKVTYDIPLADISKISILSFYKSVIFKTKDGKTSKYNYITKEGIELMKSIFEKYLPGKISLA